MELFPLFLGVYGRTWKSMSRAGGRSLAAPGSAVVAKAIVSAPNKARRLIVLLLFAVSILTLTAQSSGREWNGFAAYPGARQLCDQSVMGQPGGTVMEIHWRSYATPDATAKVIAFYEKTKVKDVGKGSDSVTFRLDKDTHLSVYAASVAHYPTCENKPKSDEKTVIVVSRATSR
jgi:hypothetical protein